MRRAKWVAAIAAAVLMTGCSASGTTLTEASVDVVDDPIDYVALGDSYGAGPLVASPRKDPGGCFRSTNNYPAYLAGHLQVATYTDVTCSGARSRDLRHPQSLYLGQPAPPQLDALTEGTDLVTLGVGGNDFGLFGALTGTCPKVRASDPDGKPCKREFTRRIDGRPVDTKARDARRVEGHVASVIEAVQERAPDAEVYVVGYPRLLPTEGTCDAVPFATGDYAWARRIALLLNRSLRLAAERTGSTYLSTSAATRGHDACAGDDAWVNGGQLMWGVAAPYHPFQAGMRGVAASVYEQITGLEAPATADAEPPAGSVVVNPTP